MKAAVQSNAQSQQMPALLTIKWEAFKTCADGAGDESYPENT